LHLAHRQKLALGSSIF